MKNNFKKSSTFKTTILIYLIGATSFVFSRSSSLYSPSSLYNHPSYNNPSSLKRPSTGFYSRASFNNPTSLHNPSSSYNPTIQFSSELSYLAAETEVALKDTSVELIAYRISKEKILLSVVSFYDTDIPYVLERNVDGTEWTEFYSNHDKKNDTDCFVASDYVEHENHIDTQQIIDEGSFLSEMVSYRIVRKECENSRIDIISTCSVDIFKPSFLKASWITEGSVKIELKNLLRLSTYVVKRSKYTKWNLKQVGEPITGNSASIIYDNNAKGVPIYHLLSKAMGSDEYVEESIFDMRNLPKRTRRGEISHSYTLSDLESIKEKIIAKKNHYVSLGGKVSKYYKDKVSNLKVAKRQDENGSLNRYYISLDIDYDLTNITDEIFSDAYSIISRKVSDCYKVGKTVLVTSIEAGLSLIAKLTGDTLFLDPNLQGELKTLDLKARLKTIDALAKDIEKKDRCNAVHESVKQVEDCVEKIRAILAEIHSEVEVHKTRWLASWRTADYFERLASLKSEVGVLDSRMDRLMKVLKVEKCL